MLGPCFVFYCVGGFVLGPCFVFYCIGGLCWVYCFVFHCVGGFVLGPSFVFLCVGGLVLGPSFVFHCVGFLCWVLLLYSIESAVIHLQFWAYGSWDSLHQTSMSPHCKLISPKHYF